MRVVNLVPRRGDGGRRDDVWAWVRNRWETLHPDIDVIEGAETGTGKFNRSAAINDAADKAGDWDAAVISDADSFVGPDQIRMAVANAVTGPCRFWLAYDCFNYLSRHMSDQIMAGFVGYWGGTPSQPGIEWTMAGTCSSMLVVTRELWDTIGGFDAGFVGWGFEDIAFSHAAQTFGNGVARVPGAAWHLHHPPSTENNHQDPVWIANRERMMRYHAVSYDQDGMRALLDELRVPA